MYGKRRNGLILLGIVKNFCKHWEKLASFKVPSLWEIRNEPLPRNAAGKIVKTMLTGEGGSTGIEE